MKGFTLIEAIVYMAVSTLICTSLISFALMLMDARAKLSENTQQEFETLNTQRREFNI